MDNLTFFDKLPLQIPEPLVIKNNQRRNW